MARNFDIRIALKLISEGLDDLRDVATLINGLSGSSKKAAAALKDLKVKIGGIDSLEEAEKKLTSIQGKIRNLREVKIDANVKLDELKFLERTLINIQALAQKTNNQSLFGSTSASLSALRDLRTQLQGAVKESEALNRPLKDIANNTVAFDLAKKRLADLNKELRESAKLGNQVEIRPKIEGDINRVLRQLRQVREEKVRLGEDTKPVEVTIAKAERTLSTLRKINETKDAINRDKIKVEATGEANLNKIIKQIRELEKALDDAKKKKNIKIIPELQVKASDIQKQLRSIEPSVRQLGSRSKLKLFDKANIGLSDVRGELNSIQKGIPTGILGFFRNLGASASEAGKRIGGIDGAIKATAGSFRLLGTASFLVGGQFRTLGFAGAAVGNILQNFGPIFARLVPAFGAFTLVLIPIASAFGLIIGQGLVLGGVLAKIAETGIKFNDEFDRTKNTIAALAAEFFTFTENGKDVGAGLDATSASIKQFDAGSKVAAQELRALSIEALKTQFTTQELFSAFQSTTTALGPLAPSLAAARTLTGQFARAAGVAKVPAAQLGSAINQVVQGTGRSTNRLQQLFNKLRDSQGIALTAARIRELRAAGGDVLFNELSAALGRFTAKVGDAQSSTISGAFSNLRDLFEIFSGDVTRKLTDNLAFGFNSIKNLFITTSTSVDELGNKVEKTDFTPPVQKLSEGLSQLFARGGNDLLSLFQTIANYIISFGDYLERNFGRITVIYDTIVAIVKQVALIVVDFGEALGLINGTGDSLTIVIKALVLVEKSALVIRGILNGIYIVANLIALGFGAIGQAIAKVSDFFSGEDLAGEFNEFNLKLIKNIDERFKTLGETVVEYQSIADRVKNINNTLKSTKEEEIKIPGSRRNPFPEDTKKGKGRLSRSVLGANQDVNKAIIDFAKEREQSELKLVQDRLKRQQELIKAELEQNLISQEAAARKSSELRNAELDNEIRTRRNAIAIQQAEAILQEKAFQEELKRLKEDESKKEPDQQSPERLQSQLRNVTLKQIADRIKRESDVKKLEEEILAIEESRVDVQKELVLSQFQVTQELRKQLLDLRKSVSELEGADTANALSVRLSAIVNEKLEEIRKLQRSISSLSVSDFGNLGDGAQEAFRQRLQVSKELLNLQTREIALRQQAESFNILENAARRETNRLRESEEAIQRRIALGQITERQGITEITAERLRYRDALLKVLATQERLAAENPLNQDQQEKVRALRLEIEKLGDTITEDLLIKANDDARNNLVDFFTKLQEGATDAKTAFADLGKSILGTFQRLISQRIVEELFGSIFGKPGQTQGRAQGFFASILRTLGLDPATKQQQDAEALARDRGPLETPELNAVLSQIKVFGDTNQRATDVILQLATSSQTLDAQLKAVTDSFNALNATINSVNTALPKIDLDSQKQSILAPLSDEKPIVGNNANKLITTVDNALKVSAKNLSTVEGVARFSSSGNQSIDRIIDQAARRRGVDATLITELLRQESNFRPEIISGKKVSSRGAKGIGQFTDATAKDFGLIKDGKDFRTDVASSVDATARYLSIELKRFGGNVSKAVAAYNAGAGNVKKFGGIPPFKETQNYVSNIGRRFRNATGLDLQSANKPLDYEQLKKTPLPVDIKKVDQQASAASGIGNAGLVEAAKGLAKFTEQGTQIAPNSLIGAPESGNVVVSKIQQVGSEFEVTLRNLKTNLETNLKGLSTVLVEEGQNLQGKQVIGTAGQNALATGALPTLGTQLSQIIRDTSFNVRQGVDLTTESVNSIAIKLDQINSTLSQLASAGATTPAALPDLSSLFEGEGFAFGGPVGYISSGAVKGKGGMRDDAIPAYLSNGEYVMQASVVQRLGKNFFDRINRFGKGGLSSTGKSFFDIVSGTGTSRPTIDTAKYNYAGGGAELLNKPAPIVEKAVQKAKKRPGGFRRFFGNLLGFAAPFLSFIPIVGPFLSAGAGALGGALTGADGGVGGAILGGLTGGLGNLGGFSGSGGFLGKLSGFFGKGSGSSLLGLLGGLGGTNSGSSGGNFLLSLLQKFGLLKRAKGGIAKFADGGLAKFFNSKEGLGALFGLSSLLGGLFGGGSGNQQPEFIEEELIDPDAARKNRYGTAYRKLIDIGAIPDFKYSEETLAKFRREAEGFKNLIRNPNRGGSGFFGSLLKFLPFLTSFLSFGKKGGGQNVDSRLPDLKGFGDVFAKDGGLIHAAFGGLIRGKGTGTSDSIPAMLSNGEYVIKASAVKSLGVDILDSINQGRMSAIRMASGGLAGKGVDTIIPENAGAIPNITNDNRLEIVNLLDPDLLANYLRTKEGQRQVVNVIQTNKNAVKNTLSR